MNDLQHGLVHGLLFLHFDKEILSHQRVRLPFPIYSGAEKMENLGAAKNRINGLYAVQMVICFANLTIPFSVHFNNEVIQEVIRLVKRNLVRENILFFALPV